MNRRAQKPIMIRSDRAYERLRLLTRDGRSQVQVVEQALDRMEEPRLAVTDDLWARIAVIQELARSEGIRSMAEFDADEYDADGNLR